MGEDYLGRTFPFIGKSNSLRQLYLVCLFNWHLLFCLGDLFAKRNIEGTPITDPLQDSTLVQFLDRFLFRNSQFLTPTRKWHLFNGKLSKIFTPWIFWLNRRFSFSRRVLGKRSQYTSTEVKPLAVDSKEFASRPTHSGCVYVPVSCCNSKLDQNWTLN